MEQSKIIWIKIQINRYPNRVKKLYDKKWKKFAKEIGLKHYPLLPNMKKMRQIIKRSGPYIIQNVEEGKFTWKSPY